MNIKTNASIPLLVLFSLLTACSTQNSSVSGSGSSLAGQTTPGSQTTPAAGSQTLPGSQLLGQQKKGCFDSNTGKAIPGCKPATKIASSAPVRKSSTVPAKTSKMRKIVLKAPVKKTTPKVLAKPSPTLKPISAPPSSFGNTSTASQAFTTPSRFGTSASDTSPTIRPRSTLTRPLTTTPTTRGLPELRPRTPSRPITPAPQPFSSGIISNPVRSAVPARRAAPVIRPVRRAAPAPRPVVKPVVRAPAPVQKPKSTMRRLTLNGSANFKSGSSRLTEKGQTRLLVMSLSLQEGKTQVSRLLIEGHTDSVGNAAMNQALSLRRANSVADYLTEKGGFTRSMMETVGLGESKPIGNNKTRKGRAQNRRVEITVTGTRQINR